MGGTFESGYYTFKNNWKMSESGMKIGCYSRKFRVYKDVHVKVYGSNKTVKPEIRLRAPSRIQAGDSCSIRCEVIGNQTDNTLQLLVNGRNQTQMWGWGAGWDDVDYEAYDYKNGTFESGYYTFKNNWNMSESGMKIGCYSRKFSVYKDVHVKVYADNSTLQVNMSISGDEEFTWEGRKIVNMGVVVEAYRNGSRVRTERALGEVGLEEFSVRDLRTGKTLRNTGILRFVQRLSMYKLKVEHHRDDARQLCVAVKLRDFKSAKHCF